MSSRALLIDRAQGDAARVDRLAPSDPGSLVTCRRGGRTAVRILVLLPITLSLAGSRKRFLRLRDRQHKGFQHWISRVLRRWACRPQTGVLRPQDGARFSTDRGALCGRPDRLPRRGPAAAPDSSAHAGTDASHPSAPLPHAPRRRVPATRSHHGDDFVDDYEWLRDKESPETLAYLRAGERATPRQRTAHLADLREQIFAEIRSPHPGDRPLRALPHRRLVVLRPLPGGPAVRPELPLPACATADDWRPPELSPDADVPERGGAARRQRARRGTRLLLPRHGLGQPGRQPAGLLAPTPSATSGSSSGSRTCAPASCSPDEVPNTLGGAVWDHARHHALLHHRRRGLAARQGVAARARDRRRRGRARLPRDRRAVLDVGRTQPQRPAAGDRLRVADDHGVPRSSTPTTRPATSGWSHRAARASSTAWCTP